MKMPNKSGTAQRMVRHVFIGMLMIGAMQLPGPTIAAPVDVVSITGGKVKGMETDVPGVQVFKGLPFAGPTGGANRFKSPQPVVPWDGVKIADTWGDQVMQDVSINPVGGFWGDEFYYDPDFLPKASENGLNLNIFTPAKDAGDKLPVYVWIHGGGNDHGYASEMEFWATKLAAKGIIVVPVQYRVGPLGFLALKDLSNESGEGSGNYAMRDLMAALKWVQDNIASFGGDPSNVTIGGQSAGSRNVGMLLRTPMAKGLFHRAVMESATGGLLDTKFPSLADKELSNKAAIEEVFGKPMSLADLRAVPAEDLIKTKVGDKNLFYALHAKVGQHIVDGTVLTEQSANLLRDGALSGIDILIGANADERTSLDGKPDGTLPEEPFASTMQKTYGEGWKTAYKASDPTHAYRLQLRSRADNLLQTALISAQYAINHNDNSRAYVYYFDNPPPGRNAEFYGSFHSADLWYFFNSLRDQPGQRPWTDADRRMADTMSSYLANFVKTGNPNGQSLPDWPQPSKGPAFIRFADGYAYPVNTTPYPSRDAVNREAVLKQYGLDETKLTR
jgi:para-nitrobenzyl esterase